jgi:hypothetical protein
MQLGTVSNPVNGTLIVVAVDDNDGHVADHGNQVAFTIALDRTVPDLDRSIDVGLDERAVDNLRRTTNVERPHG